MTFNGWIQISVFLIAVLALTRPLGVYLYHVFEGRNKPFAGILRPLEKIIYRLCGIDPDEDQDWKTYALSLLLFSLASFLVTYGILRFQGFLPLNPEKLKNVPVWLALNTAASFTTNTNWQAYAGETTMSHFSQMAGLAWQNFISAAAGIGAAMALARGLVRRPVSGRTPGVGNFWTDLVRGILYVFLPLCFAAALVLVSTGVVQNLGPSRHAVTLEGREQTLPMGSVASQEAVKMLGTNGGGFFNANSAHPFENPSPLSNFLEMVMIFAIPSALTFTYGLMAGNRRQGWVIWTAMAVLFLSGVSFAYWAESRPSPAMAGLSASHSGNMEGKETRFGIAASALFATATTDASCGAVNAMHDSFTPLGGLVPLLNIQLGEIVFGGVGAGLYGMVVFVILTVFIAGLMVGRTPEYLGKKIEAREMTFSMLYILVFPMIVLGFTAWAAVWPEALSSLGNSGPHGFSEILYAYTSATGNNGSAFAGLDSCSNWFNITLSLSMLAGRFLMIVPVLAIAGSMAGKKTLPQGPGTFQTDGMMFLVLLLSVIVIVGALTFLPALTLGPVAEHFAALGGRLF
jgi:K+-transporting ATPase ATPase A chain